MMPRYDGPPLMHLAGPIGDPSVPLMRQRRRLGGLLSGLDDEQWAAPSRCDGWSVRDVVSHLVTVDQFWVLAATEGLAGRPTRYLADFDPVATPAQLVEGTRDVPPAEVLAGYLDGIEVFGSVVADLDEERWSMPCEAPPGHLPLHLLVHHALWDAWIHERDIAVPLGISTDEEPDELLGSLRYVAALGLALLACAGSERVGTLVVEGTDPALRVVVDAGPTVVIDGPPDGDDQPAGLLHLRGSTVDLIEGLSYRAPLPQPVAESDRWLLGGLGEAFGQA